MRRLDAPPVRRRARYIRARAIALFALFVTLMVLAGHTQTAYINLFGVGLWLGWSALAQLPSHRMTVANGRRLLALLLPGLAIYGAGVALAMLLSAAQLLPTLELSSLGLRSGGLTYNEVSSFSLRPLRLPWTLLPTYGLLDLGPIFGVGYTEFVAYVGIVGLLLALWGAWRGRGPLRTMGLFFVATGLFLALGRWNPDGAAHTVGANEERFDSGDGPVLGPSTMCPSWDGLKLHSLATSPSNLDHRRRERSHQRVPAPLPPARAGHLSRV